ncbi:MAG: glycosyltransferase family 2 protein [Chloroflexota bacterium]|nr:MAG: glycosyltransferase family 2 protein [Chloroflexota bacterium]
MKDRILAIIPAYNEGARVASVVTGAAQFLPVLVVDDGSGDDTTAQAESAGATVLRQSPNQGKGAALRAAFRHALAERYDAVITLDADGQNDPAELPGFLDLYAEKRPDLIIGQRRLRHMPPIRRLANYLGRKSFSWAIGQPIPDNQSGYRLISRRLLEELEGGEEAGFEFEMEMIVICVRRGYVLDWVPIRTIYAGETSHINPVTHFTNSVRMIGQIRRTSRD